MISFKESGLSMNKLLLVLGSSSMLLLAACGGGEEEGTDEEAATDEGQVFTLEELEEYDGQDGTMLM